MNYEANRLETFANWPFSAPVDPVRIVKAGFFYTGQGMEVQCFSCRGKISEWNYGDQVMMRHRWLNRNCPFLVNQAESGNVPLVLGSRRSVLDPVPVSQPVQDQERHEQPARGEDYGLTEDDEIYKNDALRLLSYINWHDLSVSREALVNAGFYHVGGGRLRCAWCGGELAPFNDFGSLGPPLEVHRLYFPGCLYAMTLEAQRNANISPPPSPPTTPPILSPPENAETEAQSSGAAHNSRLLSVGSGSSWRSLGVVSGSAQQPRYASVAARLATFTRWPADRQQKPRALADAGFFHTGVGDQVRCFYCDGGLGKWEAGDAPWSEHARWFPHCGYVLLAKGHDFVAACARKPDGNQQSNRTTESGPRPPSNRNNFPLSESQVEECMESAVTMAALAAGLDAARVRRAIVRRLRATGIPFCSPEALIDAALDGQLNEEAWSVETPRCQRFARDILAETLRELAPNNYLPIPSSDVAENTASQSESPTRSPSPDTTQQLPDSSFNVTHRDRSEERRKVKSKSRERKISEKADREAGTSKQDKKLSLEEENRLLKEARMCKVCMDSEVSVVFLPCGHLAACAGCGAALPHCPLCRATVKALVRAYLA